MERRHLHLQRHAADRGGADHLGPVDPAERTQAAVEPERGLAVAAAGRRPDDALEPARRSVEAALEPAAGAAQPANAPGEQPGDLATERLDVGQRSAKLAGQRAIDL